MATTTPTTDSASGAAGGDRPWPSRRTLGLCALLLVALYAASLNPHWRFQRDSAIYMDLGRSMLEGRGYMHNYRPHTFYSAGFPALFTAVGALAGMPETLHDSFLAFNATTMLMGLGCVLLFYLMVRQMDLSPPLAVALVLLVATSRTLYYYSFHLMTDVPFTFLALGSLLCGLHMVRAEGRAGWGWCAGATALAAAASLVRPVGPLLVPALLAGLWLRRGARDRWRSNVGRTALLLAGVGLPVFLWSLYTRSVAPQATMGYTRNKAGWDKVVNALLGPFTRFGEHMEGISDTITGTNVGTTVGIVLSVLMLVGLVQALRRRRFMLSTFAVLNMGVIVAGSWHLDRRYLLPVLPVMFWWLVLGAEAVGRGLGRLRPAWRGRPLRRFGYVCLGMLLLLNLVRIGKVIYEQRAPNFYATEDEGRLADYIPVHRWLRRNAERQEAVAAYDSAMVHYFTRVRTVHMPYDTRERPPEWFADVAESRDVHFVLVDEREDQSTAVVQKLEPGRRPGLEQVLQSGRVTLYRLRR